MKIVISGVGLVDSGPLSILLDCVKALENENIANLELTLLVHPKIAKQFPSHRCLTYSWPKRLWLLRIFFEKVFCLFLERKLKPDLWFSLHDITPLLRKTPSIVYCHNASPFMQIDGLLYLSNFKVVLFRFFYSWLYRWNLGRNRWVIVQQDWMRKEFVRRFFLSPSRIIVARPFIEKPEVGEPKPMKNYEKKIFFYPAVARVFKNHQILGEVFRSLQNENLELMLTIVGTENLYASAIRKKYGDVSNIQFKGRMTRDEVESAYQQADALIFPSKLETWGLPLSEFQKTGKPIFAADLPYAYETLSGYKNVTFFDPDDPKKLRELILKFMKGEFHPNPVEVKVEAPFAETWSELFLILGLRS